MAKNVDLLNLFLVALAGVLAFFFPLELFIFAYAILGPLHYITEINWLRDKNYFVKGKGWVWLVLGILASCILVLPRLYYEYGNMNTLLGEVMLTVNLWSNSAIFMLLLLAIGSQVTKSKLGWSKLILTGIAGSILLRTNATYNDIIGLFIPTIIHVYLFTLLFMIYGAIKSESKMGLLVALTAILVPIVYSFISLEGVTYDFSQPLKNIYLENNFHVLPVVFSKYLGISEGKSFYFYEALELKLMMFMSFIYLYHYLNWFSKTTIIKWHKNLNTKKTVALIILWVICLGLYFLNFRLGFLFSLLLSFLHVFLEFPLNILSIKGIFKLRA